jgi:hypothetical protein
MGPALRWGNWIVAKLLQIMFGTSSLSDAGCTMRLVHREALEGFEGELTVGGSHFLPEMVIVRGCTTPPSSRFLSTTTPDAGSRKSPASWGPAMKVGLKMVGLILRYRVSVRLTMSRRRRRLRVGECAM